MRSECSELSPAFLNPVPSCPGAEGLTKLGVYQGVSVLSYGASGHGYPIESDVTIEKTQCSQTNPDNIKLDEA